MSTRWLRTAAMGLVLFGSAPAFAAQQSDLPLPGGCEYVRSEADAISTAVAQGPQFPPVQLEVRTPVAPSAFAAGGHVLLIYELHLQNFSDSPMPLRGIQVFDGTRTADAPLISFSGPQLGRTLTSVGGGEFDEASTLGAGRLAIALLCIAFDGDRVPPRKLMHRVLLDDAAADGPFVDTQAVELKTLAAPMSGSDWVAVSGLSAGAHHRSGIVVAGGLGQISRRYAVDWKRRKDGAFFSGDARDVRSYHAYGAEVRAVADATVVRAKDGMPDNIPRTAAGFETAVPVTMETVAGNSAVLDLGDGQYAYYAHLKPGSVRVRTGDRVRRGEVLGAIGNSGDAREPHLHFQVTNGPDILASEGLPYVIDRFRIKRPQGTWQQRRNEFPLGDATIDFDVR